MNSHQVNKLIIKCVLIENYSHNKLIWKTCGTGKYYDKIYWPDGVLQIGPDLQN